MGRRVGSLALRTRSWGGCLLRRTSKHNIWPPGRHDGLNNKGSIDRSATTSTTILPKKVDIQSISRVKSRWTWCTGHISAPKRRMEVSGGVLESPWSWLSTGSMYMLQFALRVPVESMEKTEFQCHGERTFSAIGLSVPWECTAHISASTRRMEVSGGVLESSWSGLSTGFMYMPQFSLRVPEESLGINGISVPW